MIALYPGCFQSPHWGHKRCIELIQRYCNIVIIGLRPVADKPGSFLSLKQRMIIFQHMGLDNCLCLPIDKATDFDIVYTGNPELIERYQGLGHTVVPLPRFEVSGTEIRRRLAIGSSIKGLVYPGTELIIRACFEAYRGRTA